MALTIYIFLALVPLVCRVYFTTHTHWVWHRFYAGYPSWCNPALTNPQNLHIFGLWKPEIPEETHANTGRTCKLHTETTPGSTWKTSCCESTVFPSEPLCWIWALSIDINSYLPLDGARGFNHTSGPAGTHTRVTPGLYTHACYTWTIHTSARFDRDLDCCFIESYNCHNYGDQYLL